MKDNKDRISITADKILFFDMDGTLVDTNLANYLSYEKAIKIVLQEDAKLIYNPKKRINRDVLKSVFPNLMNTEIKKVIQVKESLYDEFLNMTTLIDENIKVLRKYYRINKTYLVTNARKDRVFKTLEYFELTDKFSKIFYRTFDDNRKINKFANALSILDVSPTIVIAFENEETEIINAKNAGITIINPIIGDNT